MSEKTMIGNQGQVLVPDPPIAITLFQTTKFAWLWLILRVYLGYAWLTSGWGKINNPVWSTGEPLKGFWGSAVAIPENGRPSIAFGWYRDIIQFMLDNRWYEWFADVIMYGELLVGIGLILGAFTGIAAFAGSFMNWNFIMAGAASTNGMMLVLAVILMMAWKVAGWYGLDRWLLTYLGTPWHRVGAPGSGGLPQPAVA
jgi:thiosulfate dehydrogenase [quinone] large subunit